MLSGDDVRELITESAEAISRSLASHPKAGKKFRDAGPRVQEAWIAWTWLHRRLTSNGLTIAEALEVREEAMSRQNDLGTYEAIALSLG